MNAGNAFPRREPPCGGSITLSLCLRPHREAGGGRAGVETANRIHPPPPGFREENLAGVPAPESEESEVASEGEVFLA